jgi:large subunit ribosomal protein L28
MSRTCDLCCKGTVSGQNVPRKGLSRKKGGGGEKVGVRTKRTFKVNLQTKKMVVEGKKQKMRLCTRCLRTMTKQIA